MDQAGAERARAGLAARLAALGARVPVAMTRDRNTAKLRAVLNGSRAVDYVYYIENLVSIKAD